MTSSSPLSDLLARRDRLQHELAAVDDFRPGSLSAVMRRCGKPNCACGAPDHPGHGPQYLLTRKVEGKTVTTHLRAGPELEKARAQVAAYRRFKALTAELIEVNEAICAARPVGPPAEGAGGGGGGGGTTPGGTSPEKGGPATPSPTRSRLRSIG